MVRHPRTKVWMGVEGWSATMRGRVLLIHTQTPKHTAGHPLTVSMDEDDDSSDVQPIGCFDAMTRSCGHTTTSSLDGMMDQSLLHMMDAMGATMQSHSLLLQNRMLSMNNVSSVGVEGLGGQWWMVDGGCTTLASTPSYPHRMNYAWCQQRASHSV